MDIIKLKNEVFILYATTMMSIQMLEKQLASQLGGIHFVKTNEIDDNEIKFFIDELYKKQIIIIIEKMKKMEIIEEDLLNQFVCEFEEFQKKRNYVAHHFFNDNIKKFYEEKGLNQLKEELISLNNYFMESLKLDSNINRIFSTCINRYIENL